MLQDDQRAGMASRTMEAISDVLVRSDRKSLSRISPSSPPPAEHGTAPEGEPYECTICKDAGHLRLPGQIGGMVPCVCQANRRRERLARRLADLGVLGGLADKRLETFDSDVEGASEVYDRAVAYAADPQGWLVLRGGFGSGKTHLAAGIANYVHDQKPDLAVCFVVVPDLLDKLRVTFAGPSDESFAQVFERVREADLLVLDDLGAENATGWADEKLFQIFNHRYNNRMPTVVTTNIGMEHPNGRIASRLCDPDLVQQVVLRAADHRRREVDARLG